MNFKKISEKIIFKGSRNIIARTYELPDGSTKVYNVNSGNNVVIILGLTEQQQVITIEQFRFGPEKLIRELPAGTLEDGEDFKEAAEREFLEETGYQGELELVSKTYSGAYNSHQRITYIAKNCKKVASQNLDEDEFITVHLEDLNDFRKNLINSNMTHLECAYLGLDYLGLL